MVKFLGNDVLVYVKEERGEGADEGVLLRLVLGEKNWEEMAAMVGWVTYLRLRDGMGGEGKRQNKIAYIGAESFFLSASYV